MMSYAIALKPRKFRLHFQTLASAPELPPLGDGHLSTHPPRLKLLSTEAESTERRQRDTETTTAEKQQHDMD